MIMAVIAESTTSAARARLAEVAAALPAGEALIELRLDLLDRPDLDLVRVAAHPVIATCRRAKDGGAFAGSEGARLEVLRAAKRAGARFVDLEVDALDGAPDLAGPGLLASFHDFERTPATLEAEVERAFGRGAEMVKVATRVNDLVDLLALRRAAAVRPTRVVAFGLGPGGILSRLLFRRVGSPWIYARAAAPEGGSSALPAGFRAPGLPTLEELGTQWFPSLRLPDPVAVFGVLSDAPEHSIGPVVFNRFFRRRRIPALYVPVMARGVAGLREVMRVFGIRGLSVTVPLKEAVPAIADHVETLAERVRAANTLFDRGGRLIATNTDVPGVAEPIAAAVPENERGGEALVIGAGGAARAAVIALTDLGFPVRVAARTMPRAEALAAELGVRAGWPELPPRVLVNATPAGGPRDPEGIPVSERLLAAGQCVLEMNYGRATPLARRAASLGANVIRGEAMYLVQAAEQLRHFWSGLADVRQDLAEEVRWAVAARESS